jgi:hypothetical protein
MASGLAQNRDRIPDAAESAGRHGHDVTPPKESELVQRIVTTPPFRRSPLLTRFLVYICERKLNGREEEITEYQIGVQALGRLDSYSPGEDNIVRNYARILRKRLDEYFAGEGRDEELRIVIPVGHYVPAFSSNMGPHNPSAGNDIKQLAPTAPTVLPAVPSANRRWRIGMAWFAAAGLLLLALAAIAIHSWRHPQPAANLNDIFWQDVLNRNRASYLVPGDSGLAMMQEITGREIHLDDYIAGDLDKKFNDFNLAAARKGAEYGFDRVSNFTSKADLSIAERMGRLAQVYGGQLKVCYARYMNMENFKDSNVILVGGPRANPWVELFEPESNFRMAFPMRPDGIHFEGRNFVNKNPRSGEQAGYISEANDEGALSYALISFLPESNGTGHVLMLQGQGMAGTQAAGDFVLDPTAMEPILKKAQTPQGDIGPFEVLLEANTVGSNEVRSRVVVERFSILKSSE